MRNGFWARMEVTIISTMSSSHLVPILTSDWPRWFLSPAPTVASVFIYNTRNILQVTNSSTQKKFCIESTDYFVPISICFSFSQYNTRNMIFQGGIEQPLHILAWPYRAVAPQKVNIALTNYWFKLKKLLKVTILSDQANWTSVEVSLSNIYSSFLLIFKFSNSHPTDLAYLGLDSTRVTLGTCSG